MAILDKDAAKKIAKKLQARIETNAGAHDLALIEEEGVVIAQFGIRRGKKGLGHHHIPDDIHVSRREAEQLAACPMSREDWINRMIALGVIPNPGEPVN